MSESIKSYELISECEYSRTKNHTIILLNDSKIDSSYDNKGNEKNTLKCEKIY